MNRELHREATRVLAVYSGHHAAQAIPLWKDAADRAIELGDFEYAAKFLNNAGACQISLFQYKDALNTLERSRLLTERTGDRESLATLNTNIASLYLQMGNVQSAALAAERGVSFLPKNFPAGGKVFRQGDKVVLQLAAIRARQHDLARAEPLFSQAIDAAYAAGDPATAAWAWDYLGYGYYQEGRLTDSSRALTESVRLRRSFHLPNLDSSFFHLALVRADQGHPRAAAALLNSAVQELGIPGNVTPAWNIFSARGRLALSAGLFSDAWIDLSKAVEMAREWRTGIVANDANRTTSETGLSGLYASYIEAGNQLALQGRPGLARKTFQAIEENRAASLRALTPQKAGWRSRLPLDYWETLPALQEAERSLLQRDVPETRAAVSKLRCTLDDIEARSGVPPEMKSSLAAAFPPQNKLDPRTVLMSFQMGDRKSWVWAVTHERISVYPLPSRAVITGQIEKFERTLREGNPQASVLGASLYQLLFGAIPEELRNREHWLLSLDQELFSLPLSALVIGPDKGRPLYLGEVHALQVIPSALMYHGSSEADDFRGSFLGVGDPIYNRADPRWNAKTHESRLTPALLLRSAANPKSDASP
ncbi:MAG: tetratricopeptide repeat protein, partial [Acidobacteriota bacterium]|nr:tetratricopeptide repeat protein [Acidobacteriota bacterium]